MRMTTFLCLVTLGIALAACSSPDPDPSPEAIAAVAPSAERRPHEMEAHGDVRSDDYYWMRDREDPAVVAYLEAENEYTEAMTAHTLGLRETLFEEMKGRVRPDDSSVPYRLRDYWYYDRFEEGDEYPIYCRRRGDMEAPEEVMLDSNELAEGEEYFSIRSAQVSSGQDILGFAIDTVGRRKYDLRFKDLASGELLPETIREVTGNYAWAEDGKTLLYARQDPDTLRSYQIWRHTLGADPAQDALVYEEADPEFSVFVWKSRSRRLLILGSFQTLSTEMRVVDAEAPATPPRVVLPREADHEYSIDHYDGQLWIRTNWQAPNFRLMRAPESATDRDGWIEVIPHRDDVLLEQVELFAGHLVVSERSDGLVRLRIRPWRGGEEHYLDFGEPAYLARLEGNAEPDTTRLRYVYSSLTTPKSTYDYDMVSRERELLKRDEVLGDFDPANYGTERLWVTARDGVRVPVSLVYRLPFESDAPRPLLLYGYGSYGASIDAAFRADRLSLIDRGFVYAIAHVRGGEELGRSWYEQGKLLHKTNTFTDFIDCADHLVAEGYADPDRVFAMGGSAGGLLMGAVVNLRPELWRGVIAAVPFVDVVTTMLDESIPLTTSEYDEWGDPREEEYYRYMLAYSPYDNVEAKEYPPLLVTTGLHDSQVQYWEPAKWVAKLRATKTDTHPLLLRTDMEAGHSGQAGRLERFEEAAFWYAFLLDQAGLS